MEGSVIVSALQTGKVKHRELKPLAQQVIDMRQDSKPESPAPEPAHVSTIPYPLSKKNNVWPTQKAQVCVCM